MRQLSWWTVTALSVAMVAAAALALMFSVRQSVRAHVVAAGPSFPDGAPFDFADRNVRTAFAKYAQFYGDLAPIADRCDKGSGELYRVDVEAVMSVNPDFASIEVSVAGDRATVDVRTPMAKTRGWRLVTERTIGQREIDALRERAAELLASNIPPALADRYVDSSEWTVQICRRGRYHFFQRHSPDTDSKANAPFTAFTDAAMALRRGTALGS
jgi:hypothetical protein